MLSTRMGLFIVEKKLHLILTFSFVHSLISFSLIFKQVTQAGDYVLAIASIMLSRLKNDEVTLMLSQVRFY